MCSLLMLMQTMLSSLSCELLLCEVVHMNKQIKDVFLFLQPSFCVSVYNKVDYH